MWQRLIFGTGSEEAAPAAAGVEGSSDRGDVTEALRAEDAAARHFSGRRLGAWRRGEISSDQTPGASPHARRLRCVALRARAVASVAIACARTISKAMRCVPFAEASSRMQEAQKALETVFGSEKLAQYTMEGKGIDLEAQLNGSLPGTGVLSVPVAKKAAGVTPSHAKQKRPKNSVQKGSKSFKKRRT